TNIKLDYLLSRSLPCVGNVDRNAERLRGMERRRAEAQGVVVEGGIGEAKTKGKKRLNLFFLIVAIPNKNSLSIMDLAVLSWIVNISGIVLQALWEGFAELA